MKTVVIASSNKGKISEFKRILSPYGLDAISMSEAGFSDEIEETGATFLENASLKAKVVSKATGHPVLADDSGLCVDYLGGRPGVFSARYHGENTPYPEKINYLLDEMKDCPDDERTARFISDIAFVNTDGTCHIFEGICEGFIGKSPAGVGGFGFDPIFYTEMGSFAELPPEEKDRISHRGKALRAFADALPKILNK